MWTLSEHSRSRWGQECDWLGFLFLSSSPSRNPPPGASSPRPPSPPHPIWFQETSPWKSAPPLLPCDLVSGSGSLRDPGSTPLPPQSIMSEPRGHEGRSFPSRCLSRACAAPGRFWRETPLRQRAIGLCFLLASRRPRQHPCAEEMGALCRAPLLPTQPSPGCGALSSGGVTAQCAGSRSAAQELSLITRPSDPSPTGARAGPVPQDP